MIRTIIKIVGWVLLIGTAGASDLNQIDFKSMMLRIGVALLLITIGYVTVNVDYTERYND